MPQFDVHRNSGKLVAQIPYVVVLQSALYDGLKRRVVAPLLSTSAAGGIKFRQARVTPMFTIEGQTVVLNPFEIVSLSLAQLGPKVGNLGEQGASIVDALDEVFTRSWG